MGLLQRPRQHQPQNREDQPDVQKQIAIPHPAWRQDKLQGEISDDEQQPQQGQQSLTVREKFREFINQLR